MKWTKLAGAGAAAIMAVASYADLRLAWEGSGWFLNQDMTTPLLTSGNALAQLIFTPDTEHGWAQANGSSEDTGSAIDDVVLFNEPLTLANDSSGAGYAQFAFAVTDLSFDSLPGGVASGYLFIRVLDVGNVSGALVPNSIYMDSPNFTIGSGLGFNVNLLNSGPPAADDAINGFPVPGGHDISSQYGLDPGSLVVYAIHDGSDLPGATNPYGLQDKYRVAPEPGTLAFLGAGALLGLIRRFRRS